MIVPTGGARSHANGSCFQCRSHFSAIRNCGYVTSCARRGICRRLPFQAAGHAPPQELSTTRPRRRPFVSRKRASIGAKIRRAACAPIVRHMHKNSSGFTVLELMAVLAIAGVLAAVAIPAMGNFMRNSRITAAANDVVAALHFTRSESIKRRQPVTLCTSANSQAATPACANSPFLTGWIAFVDLNQSGAVDAGEDILLQHEAMNPRITARSSLAEFRVTYLLNGFALDANRAQLVLCDERGNVPSAGELSSARGILISVTGRAGVTRDRGEIQDLINAINVDFAGCDAA